MLNAGMVEGRALLAGVALCASLLAAGVAWAEGPRRVVVMDAPGKDGGANAQLLLDALASQPDRWEVQDQAWFQARVDARGLVLPDLLDDPDALVKATERRRGEEEVDVIVRPLAGRKRGSLELVVYDGASGAIVGSYEPRMKRNRIADAPDAVVAINDMTTFVGWPDAPPPPLEPVSPAPLDLELVDPEPPAEVERPKEGPLFRISAGLAGLKRDFTVVSARGGVEYSTGFYPGVRLDAELYPYPWGGAILGNLGLVARLVRGSDVVQLGLADGTVQELDSTHTEITLGAVFRHELSPTLQLRYGLGWQSLDFILASNPVYGSTTYGALWLGGQVVVGLVDKLSLLGTIEVIPWAGLGDSAAEFGSSASSFGFTGEVALAYDLLEGVSVEVGYRLRAMSASYEGEGTREINGERLADATSNDYVQEPTLRVGYRW